MKNTTTKIFCLLSLIFIAQSCKESAIAPNPISGNGNTKPTVTTPSTTFLSLTCASFGSNGGVSYSSEFTITKPTEYIFRFTSQYSSQAGIIPSSEIDNFKNNLPFKGYGIFDEQVGIDVVTLPAGTYHVGVRAVDATRYGYELDYNVTLPASDKATFFDAKTEIKNLDVGEKLWQKITKVDGQRIFIDGTNTRLNCFLIAASELNKFTNNQTFSYYSDYSGLEDCAQPGFYELLLPAGDYYLCYINPTNELQSLVHTIEWWNVSN